MNKTKKVIDFHAHILPGIDHGCRNIESSLRLLNDAANIGITTIVATPHFYHHLNPIDPFLENRRRSYEFLCSCISSNRINIDIIPAAEVYLEPDMFDDISTDKIKSLAVGDTDYILIELPAGENDWSGRIFDSLYRIESNTGLRPIIAHVERYSRRNREHLMELPCVFQINAEKYTSFLGIQQLVSFSRRNTVQLLGSDIHDCEKRNYTDFAKVISKLPGKTIDFFMSNAAAILDNEDI